MIKSMTGFGRGQAPASEGVWTVELKTLNSRFLDPHLRLPSGVMGLEERIKKHLGERLSRGRINLNLTARGVADTAPRLVLNRPLVREYRRVLDELREELGAGEELGLGPFLNNRDLITVEDADPDLDALWDQLRPALDEAMDHVEEMRATEGAALAQDLAERIARLEVLFQEAASRSPEVVENYRQRLNERIAKLTDNGQVDPQRLAQEVALVADKCDITEEAVRAASHLAQFRELLAADGPVGRKLDFLIQELNREANTMGSKSPDAEAGQVVVEIKTELERLREQVQNIE